MKLAEAIDAYSDYLAHARGWRHKQSACRCDKPAWAHCRKCGPFCEHCGGRLVIGKAAEPDANQDASSDGDA